MHRDVVIGQTCMRSLGRRGRALGEMPLQRVKLLFDLSRALLGRGCTLVGLLELCRERLDTLGCSVCQRTLRPAHLGVGLKLHHARAQSLSLLRAFTRAVLGRRECALELTHAGRLGLELREQVGSDTLQLQLRRLLRRRHLAPDRVALQCQCVTVHGQRVALARQGVSVPP